MKKLWKVIPANIELSGTLGKELNILPITAQLLINRGLVDPDKASSFLNPDLKDLHDPFLMKGMERGVSRIIEAIKNDEAVAIYGDYDVDGMTSSAVLTLFLREVGARTVNYIPNRISEGYGLNKDAIDKLSEQGVKLIVTVDLGVSNVDEVAYAAKLGIDIVITDHHECPEKLPEAYSLINPKQPGCDFPFKGLAGVGVAFNLVVALRARLRDAGYFKNDVPKLVRYLDIVAIGTVADVVPLIDENRIFVSHGLKQLNVTERVGLRALYNSAGLQKSITADNIAFQIAPRLNAAGRVGSAEVGLRLLISEKTGEAKTLARELERENQNRQKIEKRILDEALLMVGASVENARAIVLASSGWHPGVIGIVASRLVDRYSKPAVMIALEEDEDKDGFIIGKGSGRSIKGVDLLGGLVACSEHLIRYGGHKAAAGLTLKEDDIDAFRGAFLEYMDKALGSEDFVQEVNLDAVVSLSEVDSRLSSEIERLSPFGLSNRAPLLCAMDTDIVRAHVVGSKHLRMRVRQNGSIRDCIAFGMATKGSLPKGDGYKIAFYPYMDEWQGSRNLRLRVADFEHA